MRTLIKLSASTLILGSFLVALPAAAAEISLTAGPGIKWNTDPPSSGDPEIPFKKGDVLIVRLADPAGPHGFRFTGAGAPTPSNPIPLCAPAPPAGTVLCQESGYSRAFPGGANATNEILRLRALEDLPADMPFNCVVHGNAMRGTLKK